MAALEPIVAGWWRWIVPLCAQIALLALVLGLLERALSRRAPAGVRAAFAWAVWLRLLLPPGITSPLAVGRLVDVASWDRSATLAAGVPWMFALFALWLLGAVLAGVWTARTLMRERVTWLAGALAADPGLQAIAQAAAARLRLAPAPRVLLQAGASGPAAVGWLRPCVVLPAEWAASAPEKELQGVLLHEFAHVTRRDGLAAFAWMLARIVFWFHPLVHWTAARAATLREIGADELAVRASGSLRDYRRTLLEQARPLAIRAGTGFAGFIPTGSQILARLEALERPAKCSASTSRAAAIATFALLAVCCVPLAQRATPSMPSLADYQGCLRKRYAVLAALAQQPAHDPNSSTTPSQETRP